MYINCIKREKRERKGRTQGGASRSAYGRERPKLGLRDAPPRWLERQPHARREALPRRPEGDGKRISTPPALLALSLGCCVLHLWREEEIKTIRREEDVNTTLSIGPGDGRCVLHLCVCVGHGRCVLHLCPPPGDGRLRKRTCLDSPSLSLWRVPLGA